MAQSDWTDLSDNLSSSALKFITPGGLTPPPGGGSFLGAWRSQSAAVGLHSKFYNGSGFVPHPKGGIIQAALQRSTSAGPAGFAVFLFICLGGLTNANTAYMLGLADSEPAHLVLRKGSLVGGLPDVAPGQQGVIWRSTDVIAKDIWAHVQLMCAVNPNGDAVLSVWRNDLTLHNVTAPTWVQVPGINILGQNGSGITDDAAGIATGSAALVTGRMGFGCVVSDIGRVAKVDHIEGVAQS